MLKFTGDSGAVWSYDENERVGDPSGFGLVFRGESENGDPVAIKRVGLRWGSEEERRLRAREVEIADVLAAPNSAVIASPEHLLVPLDRAYVDDQLLLVMPLAQMSLKAAIESRALEESEKLNALKHVVLGLGELGQLGILHRDLKPANVLHVDGVWKLADFGIAKNLAESTATYTFHAGTWPYMAPELWLGQPATVKTDLYAFGVTAYELMTGVRPFAGDDESAYRSQHLNDAPDAPGGAAPGLSRLILRLLAKRPAERPQDARAVAEYLESVTLDLPPKLAGLQEAALVAERRRRQAEADDEQRRTTARAYEERRTQAISDLAAILEEAAEGARTALPEVALRSADERWQLAAEAGRVLVALWSGAEPKSDLTEDQLLIAGEVHLDDVGTSGQPHSNVVCEERNGRLEWHLLRFRANALVGNNYNLGPRDRPHGFSLRTFSEERAYMVRHALHIWQMDKRALTPQVVVELLEEAIRGS